MSRLIAHTRGFYSASIPITLVCKKLAPRASSIHYAELPSAHVRLPNDGVGLRRWGGLPLGLQVPKPAVASCKISDAVSLNGSRSAREIYHKDPWPIAGRAYPKACFDTLASGRKDYRRTGG
jgi:hypothetical protein